MKKKNLLNILIAILMCLCISACTKSQTKVDLWENAIYTEDAELGEGEKTVLVEVVAEDKSVTFTVHSDKDILGDALTDNKLIVG